MCTDLEKLIPEPFNVDKLLENEDATVEFFKNHTVIEASAGTGKTYTIEKLLKRLVDKDFKGKKDLSKILVVTFTDKAAGELKHRIGMDDAEVYTIHSFCKIVLDTYSFEAKVASRVALISNKNLLNEMVERNCREKWVHDPRIEKILKSTDAETIQKAVKGLAAEKKPNEVILLNYKTDYHQFCKDAAENVYKEWKSLQVENREQIFDDLVTTVQNELNQPGSLLLGILRNRYSYAVIDEFQDTNIAQWSIFKKIFMEDSDHRIMVVGDPKQAIFGFQGSNLNVYDIALEEMKQAGGKKYSLKQNFRSSSDIIKVCNGISKTLIANGFDPSKFGDPKKTKEKSYFATSSPKIEDKITSPVRVCEIYEKKVGVARKKYFAWVLKQIQNFHIGTQECNVFIPEKKEKDGKEIYEPRPLRYSDITILGRTGFELYTIMDFLHQANIPCARYKDENLFKGLATTHWATLLKGIDCIFEKDASSKTAIRAALLTSFFEFTTIDVGDLEDTSSAPEELQGAIKFLEEMNRKHAKDKKWGSFVERILRKTGVEERFAKCKDFANLAEFRQVADFIVDSLYNENLDLSSLSRRLLQYRDEKRDPSGKNDKIIGKDSDNDQIQLMTMHVSKGLEFPVVFVIGGVAYNYKVKGGRIVYNEDGGSEVRSAILSDKDTKKEYSAAHEEAKKQTLNEWYRLLYVAITRTSFLCYLPKVYVEDKDGFSGDQTLNRALNEILTSENKPLKELIAVEKVSKLEKNIPPLPLTSDSLVNHDEIDSLLYGDGGAKKSCEDAVKSIKAQLPDLANLEGVRTSTILVPKSSSYSALSGYKCGGPTADESTYRSDDPMPGGANYGNALHHIFEQIDFQRGRDCEKPENKEYVENLIKRNLRSEGVDVEKWFERYWDMIKCTLKTKFKDPYTDKTICLGDIPACDRRHEMSFDSNAILKADKVVLAPENAMGEVLFNGSIDLLFRYEGRWYILDWKSNKIGGDKPYSRNNIKENMIHHKYNLQCALYANVFLHWYSRFVQKNIEQTFKEDFGGVIYCYNRGCKEQPGCCDVENVEGFYFEKWENDFKMFQGEIQKDSTDPYEGHDLFDLEHAVNIPFRKLLCEKPVEEAKESEDDPADK